MTAAPNAEARSFTAVRDSAADARIRAVLPELAAAVVATHLPGFAGLVLGGGYGRGEGGATADHRLYNDLDFFILLNEPESAFPALAERLAPLSRTFCARLGVDVDFTLRSAHRIKLDERRLMVQELLRGHVVLSPADFDLSAWSGARPYAPSELPAGEAARLLMNRGMGLALARQRLAERVGRPDGFVLRNLSKAVLGAGDARLIAQGRYAWRLDDREKALGESLYAQACAFKRRPSDAATDVATWDEAFRYWQAAADELMECRGRELCRRSGYQLARWIVRRRSSGPWRTLGMDCTTRVLLEIRSTLERGVTPEAIRDWEVFN